MSDIKQLCIISGKGGTGKTTIAAALASLAENAVFADCDVDAADLHLILKPEITKSEKFSGMKIASIDRERCDQCGLCYEKCRFDAIDEDIKIIENHCEGCGVCKIVCPESAIELIDRQSGWLYTSETRFGPMSHAALNIAEEASGKLVAGVRNNAKELAEQNNKYLIVIDGPPGIGCPVISALSGVDLVLIVTEPTVAGVHDLKRILNVASHFNIKAAVCINKFDLNPDNTKKIGEFCGERGLKVVSKLPYSNIATDAMLQEQSIIEYEQGCSANKTLSILLCDMWIMLQKELKLGQ